MTDTPDALLDAFFDEAKHKGDYGPARLAIRTRITAGDAAMTRGAGVPQWRTDMENAPDGPHLRGVWINVVRPNTSAPDSRYLDVYAGSIDDETGEFLTINGDDTGWPTDEFTLWCPLPGEAAAPQPPALDRDAVIEACAATAEDFDTTGMDGYKVRNDIAAAIRAMKVQK